MFSPEWISFRTMTREDFRQVFEWLRNPAVAQWYGPTPCSISEIENKYEPRISGEVPVACYIAEYDGRAVGFIQTYQLTHDPEYAEALDMPNGSYGVDLFIGEDEFRHCGFGPIMLQEFVKLIVFDEHGARYCVIAPEINNTAAIRAYEKAGFNHVKTVPVPGEPEPEYVMVLKPVEGSRSIDC
jgi:aminoglycoside 6'-N-acetyltransferase